MMRRFHNILFVDVTTAASMPPAFDEARRLAAANEAKLTIFSVVPKPPRLQGLLRLGTKTETLESLVAAEHRARLTAFSETLEYPDIEVDVSVGAPPTEIVRRVIRERHDLVIVTTDGSEHCAATARRVMRLCPVPVWVLRPNFTGAKILAAIDPDDDHELNQLILELAASQSVRYLGQLQVVHAWEPYGRAAFAGSECAPASPQLLANLANEAESVHREAFDAAVAGRDLPGNVRMHLVDGPPYQAITRLIELYRIDLLVMGSVGRGGLLVGNTAEQLLKDVSCSVLVVKPPGFVSPVANSARFTPRE
jgi:universal stress protein E